MCNRYRSLEPEEIEEIWRIRQQSQHTWGREVFPRAPGPFLRLGSDGGLELAVGQWGLIPWFAKSPKLAYSTNNARVEEVATKASFKQSWNEGRRCIIPAWSFDEPCWETGKNVWWRFKRTDGKPWSLAGLWNTWIDKATGEIFDSYTMLTINADDHPVMSRMHKPDPKLPPDQQDKRSVIAIDDVDAWLSGSGDLATILRPPAPAVIEATPLSMSQPP